MALELVNKLPYDHPYRWDGTLFGGPKLWRPDELGASLALWLDAEDASTITLNGSSVSQWSDKSGGGNNATQAVAAAQPAYNATGFNSKPALVFDGTSDWMQAGTGLNLGSQHFIVAAIRALTVGGSNPQRAICKWGPTTPELSWMMSPGPVGGGLQQRHIVQSGDIKISQYTQSNITTAPALYGGELQAGTLKTFVNGTEGATVVTGVGAPQATATTVTLGVLRLDTPDRTNMVTAEYIIANGAQATVANRQRVEGYLAWKWGLEANLPVDHPYKNTPPTV